MDDDLKDLIAHLPPTSLRRQPSAEHAKILSGHLPEKLFEYWREVGLGGFGDGLFWLVDPIEYSPVAKAWAEAGGLDSGGLWIIARSAFGQLFLWDESTTSIVTISASDQTIYRSDARTAPVPEEADLHLSIFIGMQNPDDLDLEDVNEKGLFRRALKKLGPLNDNEMYGFEPALVLGGMPVLENLRKVSAIEHLLLLPQLGDVEIVSMAIRQHLGSI
ncbi:hypothetical protein B0920_04950 [Massilia sp. KIM]|uniref:GAD-like domain-containing protein n=1 Tax=Massilia sp. KIM TaxID=1955422 RepID=UPI00098F60A7|nr:GAD-like domain-containing protein [Massilia sp. KIM]OON62784.1 hypothetical protein B0920_04950 [Massilia sp. KIM]